jgi:hypothetical protein
MIGTLSTKESNLKEGKIGPTKRTFFIFFLLSIYIFIHFRNQKNYSWVEKILGAHLPPCPQVTPIYLSIYLSINKFSSALQATGFQSP